MRLMFLSLLLFVYPLHGFSQGAIGNPEDSVDYTGTIHLDELIITGQYEPQSVENSVYHVRVINKDRIQSQAAVSLNEVLANELNVRLSQDLAISNSSLSLQGISGNNIKVLLDGVPIVGRNGNGNDTDLSQVNLYRIERIEIVEGPMAVNYGANALAGVINIVTDKNSALKTAISASVQEETIGNEYGLDKGRHIQNLYLGHNFSGKWFARVNASRNVFSGFQGNFDGRRKEWNPKTQWVLGALANFRPNDGHEFYYKIDYLDENIESPGQIRYDISANGKRVPFAFDEKYHTNRTSHHLQGDGHAGRARYSITFARSDFNRIKSRYSKNLDSGIKTLTTADGDQDTSLFNAVVIRGSLIRPLGAKCSVQGGYDINIESAKGGRLSEGRKAINDWGFYITSEWLPFHWVKIRPGIRYALNSVYKTPLLPSINLKSDLNASTFLRFAYGRGYRAPSIRELYFEFVDSNHRIYGNEGLEPEYSHHFDGNLTRKFTVDNSTYSASLGGFFNDINNLITISQSSTDATAATYVNVLRHKTLGFTFEHTFSSNRVNMKTGFSYTGRHNRLSAHDSLSLKNFFYSPDVNANLGYAFPKIGLNINLFYKYNGKLKSYQDQGDGSGIQTGEVGSYHLMDLTVSKKIGHWLNLQTGAKNLLDVVRINTTSAGNGTHSGGDSIPVSYGRSYFLKLTYNLNID